MSTDRKAWLDIRRTETGEVRRHPEQRDWDAEYDEFLWDEGNFACDCNRHHFFREAGNEPDDYIPCSMGLYDVRLTDVETGAVLYEDGENWL